MCRKIFAVGDFEMEPLLRGLQRMAEDRNSYHENNHGIHGTFTHYDGWGVAFLTDIGWHVVRSVLPCTIDAEFEKLLQLKPKAVMLHARQATAGGAHISNSHPFVKDTIWGRIILSHNGTIKGLHREDILGTTDTEAFLATLLENMKDNDLLKSLKITQDELDDYSGLNLIINTPEKSYVQVKYKSEPRYYTMQVHSNNKFTIVSSEPLFEIADFWEPMQNDELLVFDHTAKKPKNFIKLRRLLAS